MLVFLDDFEIRRFVFAVIKEFPNAPRHAAFGKRQAFLVVEISDCTLRRITVANCRCKI